MNSPAPVRKRDAEATKQRLLAAAVKHFGLYGFAGASMRNIVADADANLASANYYFGSKAKLLVAAIDRYIVQTHARRFELLEAALEEPAVRPRLRALIAAYLRPHIEMTVGEQDENIARLVLRVITEDNMTLQLEFDRALLPIRQRLRVELQKCCPDTDAQLINSTIRMIVSVLSTAPLSIDAETLAISGLRSDSAEAVLEEATQFAYGGAVALLGLAAL